MVLLLCVCASEPEVELTLSEELSSQKTQGGRDRGSESGRESLCMRESEKEGGDIFWVCLRKQPQA